MNKDKEYSEIKFQINSALGVSQLYYETLQDFFDDFDNPCSCPHKLSELAATIPKLINKLDRLSELVVEMQKLDMKS